MKDRFPQGIWPVDFPEANRTLHAPPGMDNCEPMRFCRSGADWIGCWHVSWRARLAILLGGRIYTRMVSHGNAAPLALCPRRSDVFAPVRPLPWLLRVIRGLR